MIPLCSVNEIIVNFAVVNVKLYCVPDPLVSQKSGWEKDSTLLTSGFRMNHEG